MSSKGAQAMLLEAWQQETWQVARRFKDALRTLEPGMRVGPETTRAWPNLSVLRSAGFIRTADGGTGWYRVLRRFDGHRVGSLARLDDCDCVDRLIRWGWVEHANAIEQKSEPVRHGFRCDICHAEVDTKRGLAIHKAKRHPQ